MMIAGSSAAVSTGWKRGEAIREIGDGGEVEGGRLALHVHFDQRRLAGAGVPVDGIDADVEALGDRPAPGLRHGAARIAQNADDPVSARPMVRVWIWSVP